MARPSGQFEANVKKLDSILLELTRKGTCWAGNRYLGKQIGKSIRQVERYLSCLTKRGKYSVKVKRKYRVDDETGRTFWVSSRVIKRSTPQTYSAQRFQPKKMTDSSKKEFSRTVASAKVQYNAKTDYLDESGDEIIEVASPYGYQRDIRKWPNHLWQWHGLGWDGLKEVGEEYFSAPRAWAKPSFYLNENGDILGFREEPVETDFFDEQLAEYNRLEAKEKEILARMPPELQKAMKNRAWSNFLDARKYEREAKEYQKKNFQEHLTRLHGKREE